MKWERGSGGGQRYRCIPRSAANNLGKIPLKNESSKSLVLKTFSGESTVWDSSLLVSLTLWDTPVLCTPPLPFTQMNKNGVFLLELGWQVLHQGCRRRALACSSHHGWLLFLRGRGLQTYPNLHPPLWCLPRGGANLCRFVPVQSL